MRFRLITPPALFRSFWSLHCFNATLPVLPRQARRWAAREHKPLHRRFSPIA